MSCQPQAGQTAGGADWLAGGGDMGARIRAADWSQSPLGPPAGWPPELRAAVGICLHSRFPMFVWWGPGLINLYNDAYAPVLGARHPAALGRPARDVWGEIWPIIGPQADAVLGRGESTWNERVRLVMERHGYAEETWFTWSYSPIHDAAGRVAGLFCACQEDTARVVAERDRDDLAAQRQLALDAARMGWWHYDPATQVAKYDARFQEIFGVAGSERPNDEILARLHPDDLPGVWAKVEAALDPADPQPYSAAYRIFRDDGSIRWIEAHGVATFAGDGPARRAVSFVGTVADATDRRRADELPRTILESITDAFFAVGRDWRFTYVNPQAERVLGRQPGDLLGKTIWDEYPGLRGSEFEALYLRAAGEEVAGSVTAFYPDHGRWYEVHAYPAPDGISVYFRDVTGRRRGEDALRESEERFRAAFDQAAVGIALVGLDGRWVRVNPTLCDILGYTRDELFGLTFQQITHPADLDADLDHVRRVLAGEIRTYSMEKRYVRKDGATVWANLTVSLVGGAGAGYFVSVIEDISGRRAAEEAVRRARDEAERASRMKDEFLATLSHELRTPLNAILGWAQLLRASPPEADDVRQGLETIERNARAQTQIIEDLLDMSRIVGGRVRLDVRRVDLAASVRAAVETLRPAADAKGVRLQAVLDPLARLVSGDPARLQQVFWNLLGNAVKFTPRGGRVQVVLERVNSHLEVSVTDTGEGIPADFLPHAFDRFRQADASTTRRHGGLGLGLAIVKQLVELHGGTVRADSPGPGRGATFTVSLPLAVVHPEGDLRPDRRHPGAPDAGAPVLPADCVRLAGVKVLVVDDEPDARAVVKRVLEACDAVVATAGSAAEALDRLRIDRPDVLVSDIGMPDEDGYALLRRVRALAPAAGGDTPAVALTAYARAEDRMKAVLAGFQHHVTKPAEPAELVTMVASLAGRVGRGG